MNMLIEEEIFKNIRYCVFKPNDFDARKRYPIILYLHGSGERGDDIDLVENCSSLQKIASQCEDAIVFAPQCDHDTWFDMFEQLIEWTEYVHGLPYTNQKRFYLTGISMGGYASNQLLMSCPNLFAAAIVCCGGGMYWNAKRLKDIPVRLFHGEKDRTVYPEESRRMYESLCACGADATLTVYPECDHNCWDTAFDDKENMKWLLRQEKE